MKRSLSQTRRLPGLFVKLADEGGGHCSQERAVVKLESDLGADQQFMISGLQNKVVTTGITYPDSCCRLESFRVYILPSDRQDGLQDFSTVVASLLLPERILRNITRWF